MKLIFTIAAIVIVWCFLMAALLYALYGSWARVLCSFMRRGLHDYEWLYNEPKFLPGEDGWNGGRAMWVGIYRCRICADPSEGCARWEQRSREMRARFESECL